MADLFSAAGLAEAPEHEAIAPDAILLRAFALPFGVPAVQFVEGIEYD